MADYPPEIRVGDPIKADWLNSLLRAVKANDLTAAGNGLLLDKRATGTGIKLSGIVKQAKIVEYLGNYEYRVAGQTIQRNSSNELTLPWVKTVDDEDLSTIRVVDILALQQGLGADDQQIAIGTIVSYADGGFGNVILKSSASSLHPFRLYVGGGTGDSAWRTFRVQAGLIQGQHADYDDSASPTNITTIEVPESTELYKVWLDCDIEIADSNNIGGIIGATIEHGETGWTDFPAQPYPDLDLALPPDKLYVLLGEITTGVDSNGNPQGDPTARTRYLKVHQYIKSSLGAGITPDCQFRRMDIWRA